MSTDAFQTAYDALTFADEATATHGAQSAHVGDRGESLKLSARRAGLDEPTAIDRLNRSAITMTGDGVGPLVIVGWPAAKLPPKGWQDGHVWRSGRSSWMPEDQPQGPTLYGKPARLNIMGSGSWEPSYGSRGLTLAVINDPADAPNTMPGTRALVAAVIACDTSANQLRDAADSGEYRPRQANGFRAEADALAEHADACHGHIKGSLAWLAEFERSLVPVPPFAPIYVPVQLRGYVIASPI